MDEVNLVEQLSKHEQLIQLGLQKELFIIKEDRITYISTGKSYKFSDPEEKVRASTFTELVTRYQYPVNRIEFEKYPPRREPKLPADIVVYREDNKKDVFLVVECKANSDEAEIIVAKKEGLGNATLLSADWLMSVCGEEEIVYYVSRKPSLGSLEGCRAAELPINYSEAPKYRFKKKGDLSEELRIANSWELDSKFQRCHNLIWDGGKRDPAEAFDEMSKLMFAKIYDEKFTKVGNYYKFQVGTNEKTETVASRIKEVYGEVQEKEPGVFKEPISIADRIIYEVVKVLQDISLTRTDLDSKGRAFEKFLGKVFRGDFGQFFTPREVVDFIVQFIDVDYKELVIDPACGSGGFLLYAIKHVIDKAQKEYGDEAKEVIWNFSHNNVFGIEINSRLARIAMMDMVIHEDGHTNIECDDALDDYSTFDARNSIQPNKYDVVMTNPPFGSRINRDIKHYFDNYTLSRNKDSKPKKSEMSEILFLERCIDLLRPPNGRLAIVLPDSAFTNKSYIPVVDFIKKETSIDAIVSLPQHTFVPFGSMAKTSILFLRKKLKNQGQTDNLVFMAQVDRIGYDANGRSDTNNLPNILSEWREFNSGSYPPYKELSPGLWTAAIPSSRLENKLDVEAYNKEYVEYLQTVDSYRNNPKFSVVRLGEITTKIFAGVGPANSDYVTAQGIPIIKTAAIIKVQDRLGIIDWKKVGLVSPAKYDNSSKMIMVHDILVQSVAHNKNYIGDKVAIVDKMPTTIHKLLPLSKFLVIRPNNELVAPYYLFLFLASSYSQVQYRHYVMGMTAEIYEFDLKNLWVILPKSRKAQEETSSRVSDHLSEIIKLEARISDRKSQIATAITFSPHC